MIPRLKEQYDKNIVENLRKKFSVKNKLMVPKLVKVVLNMGLGPDGSDKKKVQNCLEDMSLISGQMPVLTKFKKSISNFKTRKGSSAGVKVTLRSKKMYEFVERLINAALPRIRDFRGVSRTSFDGRGNYSLGLREQVMFPEIDYNRIDRIRGLQVTFVTTAKSDVEGRRLLELFGMPFERDRDRG
mgnify:CR=1 FL=1